MKRHLLLLFFASISAQLLFAQKFSLGTKVGVSGYSMMYQDREIREEVRNGVRGGYFGDLVVGFPLPDNYSFIAEAGIARRGRRAKTNFGDDGYFWINTGIYNFLQSSLLLRKEFPLNMYDFKASWYLNFGPNINYWMGGKGSIRTSLQSPSSGFEYDIQFVEQFVDSVMTNKNTMYVVDGNRWLFGLDFGVGFKTQFMTNQNFFGEIRFTYGHTYLGQSYSPNLYILGFNDNFRNAYRTINISFGYAYSLDLRRMKKGKSTFNKKRRRSP